MNLDEAYKQNYALLNMETVLKTVENYIFPIVFLITCK